MMIDPENRECEVCHRIRDVWVHSGSLGPYSIASCRECLEHYAEPIWAVEAILLMSNGGRGLCPEYFSLFTWHPRRKEYVRIGDLKNVVQIS
jgi:hypothetical protein